MSSKHLNPLWDLPEKHRNFGNTSRLQDAIITVVADIIKNIMGFFFFFLLRTYNELLIASTESTHGAISDLTLQKMDGSEGLSMWGARKTSRNSSCYVFT